MRKNSTGIEIAFLVLTRHAAMEVVAAVGAGELHEAVGQDGLEVLAHAALLQGRAEVEGFFKEVEGWRKEIGEKLSKLQAEQIEKAYREMTAAVDVVADRAKVDIVLRFVPTAQAFESNTPADAMLSVQVRTFLHYPEAIDLTPELLKELSLKDE